jgi:hypothetical protein
MEYPSSGLRMGLEGMLLLVKRVHTRKIGNMCG